jgi:hypothetical protein
LRDRPRRCGNCCGTLRACTAESPADTAALAAFAERTAAMPASLVASILDLEQAPHRSQALVDRLRGVPRRIRTALGCHRRLARSMKIRPAFCYWRSF